jgi:predicted DsbA family dithiol-disulfide isomerase
MAVVIPVYFDYASALCFIAQALAPQLESDLDITFDWRPVQIAAHHPGWRKGEPLGAEARSKIERVAAETGVAVRIPDHWLDSRAALEGAIFARAHERLRDYHARVFEAAFVGGEDIADRYVLTRIARDSGLPVGEFMQSLATRAYGDELAVSTNEATRLGVAGYPTFFLGEFPLTGIHPLETMRLLLQRYIERVAPRSLH